MTDEVKAGILIALFVVVGLVATALFVWSLIRGIRYLLRTSGAYRRGTFALTQNARAREVLGEPIEFGNPGGQISVGLVSGYASIDVPVSGPAAAGTLRIRERRILGHEKASYELLVFGQETIDLSPDAQI